MKQVLRSLIFVIALTSSSMAEEPTSRQLVKDAETAFAAGEYQAALEAYTALRERQGDSPPIAYNQGLAHYKLGQLEEARAKFGEALAVSDKSLEAQTKFNLGNCDYAEALTQRSDPQVASDLLDQAIEYYHDALELAPTDGDARANIEMAQRLIEQLKQQQQQQQQQNQQQDDQQSQENEDSEQQDQPQKGNQNDNNQQQNQQQQQGGESNDNRQEEQPPQQSGVQNDNQQNPEASPQEQEQPSKPDESPEQQQPEAPQEPQDDEAPPREITPQEAERILQAVRDKERQRNEEKGKRIRAQRAKVAKDW